MRSFGCPLTVSEVKVETLAAQELQKYIAHVESLAAHRKIEIEKLNEDKRDLEKVRDPT